jgi:hypothetical protein
VGGEDRGKYPFAQLGFKIVRTKNDSRDGDVELLLPFSAEAEQLSFDIELMKYLAQAVLIAGSLPFQVAR